MKENEDGYWLAVHLKTKDSKGESKLFQNPKGIAITYFKREDATTISRSLKHKGYSETFVLQRKVSQDERDSEIPIIMYRIKYTIYSNWQKLIDDELKFDLPDDWITKIEELKKQYKHLIPPC